MCNQEENVVIPSGKHETNAGVRPNRDYEIIPLDVW